MLTITIPARELFNEETCEFIYTDAHTIQLEHSLVSVSKWEMKWHKSFLSQRNKTEEELIDYIRCMTVTQNVPPEVYFGLTQENINEIKAYIQNPMTATTFNEEKGPPNREVITNELIYYWMISLEIPVEFEKWHLNRLLTLIKVCSIKNDPKKKKMSKSAILHRNASLNAARRQAMGTKG